MNITYYVNEKAKTVYAVGHSREGYAEGIDENVADVLVLRNIVRKKDLLVPQMTRCVASACEPDEFDVETGKAIARDKVLAKYYARVNAAISIYKKGLEALVEDAESREKFCSDKVRNAKARLEEVE